MGRMRQGSSKALTAHRPRPRRCQVRIDGSVFTVNVKAKHEFSASCITLDRKVSVYGKCMAVVEVHR